MVSCHIFELVGLLVDDVGGILQVVIDELFVVDVDEGSKVENGGGNKAEAPERSEFDEPVGDQRSGECLEILGLIQL